MFPYLPASQNKFANSQVKEVSVFRPIQVDEIRGAAFTVQTKPGFPSLFASHDEFQVCIHLVLLAFPDYKKPVSFVLFR